MRCGDFRGGNLLSVAETFRYIQSHLLRLAVEVSNSICNKLATSLFKDRIQMFLTISDLLFHKRDALPGIID